MPVTKYVLNDSEREIFLKKILPTIFIGSLIWLISEIVFAMYYTKMTISPEIAIFIYVIINVFNAVLFVMFYIRSRWTNHDCPHFLFHICVLCGYNCSAYINVSSLGNFFIDLRSCIREFISWRCRSHNTTWICFKR